MALGEAFIEEELYYLVRIILKKNDYEINGVRFGGLADLVLPLSNGKPFLVIECKGKISKLIESKTSKPFY